MSTEKFVSNVVVNVQNTVINDGVSPRSEKQIQKKPHGRTLSDSEGPWENAVPKPIPRENGKKLLQPIGKGLTR